MGDALLQKTHTVDFLTKKRVKNKGIVQQYYVEDSHPPIINKEEFASVQAEFERRSKMRGYSQTGKSAYTSEYAFSGKLFCQNCGSKFRRASWGTGKNKQYVWRCINREQNGVDKCGAKTVKEKALEQAFLRVMNLTKFDEEIFRRLIEKVKVQSMVGAVFVFKTGVEVREIF
ncbi:MAG: recombinase zinc beta ribbon domain-containing protein [Desulfitobacteriaceae bacterium]